MSRKWLIEKLGGYATTSDAIKAAGAYATIEDAIEAIRKTNLKERQVILTMAVKKLFNTIGPDDILKPVEGGEWLFAGRTLSKGQVELLMHEAAQLEQMLLWKVIQQDIKYQVNKKLYTLSENVEHVVTAKFWAYTFDTIQTRLKSIAAGSPLFNKKGKE